MFEQQQHWMKGLLLLLAVAVGVQTFLLVKVYRRQDIERSLSARVRSESPVQRLTAQRRATPRSAAPSAPGTGPDSFDDWFVPSFDEWDPFAEMERVRERMSRMMDDTLNRMSRIPGFRARADGSVFTPQMDLTDEGTRYVIRFDIPGADKSSLSVRLDDRLLTVEGESGSVVEEKKGGGVLRLERRSGRFQRSLTLPGPVEAEKMEARYENGVLTVILPKAPAAKGGKSIRIS